MSIRPRADDEPARRDANRPLAGVRIVDLTTTLSGPYSTLLLADLGADVVKIEAPGGDPVRELGPRVSPDMGAIFMNLNRSKRSVVLDLATPLGRRQLREVTLEADVFIHNMRPSAAERCEVTDRHLRAGNERLIHCAIRGYGPAGPYRDRPAYDDIIQAGSGIAAQQAWVAERPQYVASAIADKVAGMMGALAISAAVVRQEATGQGCALEVPMFECAVAFGLVDHLYGHTFVPPRGPARYPRQASKARRPFRTADGWIAVVVYTNQQWQRFLETVGRADLADDARFKSLQARADNVDELCALIETILQSDTTDRWLERLTNANIPTGRYNSVDDLFTDEHLIQSHFFQPFEHPSEGSLIHIPAPVTVDGHPIELGTEAPRLGQHTDEVLDAPAGSYWSSPARDRRQAAPEA